eukprot:480541-Rhodomonas_salina.1
MCVCGVVRRMLYAVRYRTLCQTSHPICCEMCDLTSLGRRRLWMDRRIFVERARAPAYQNAVVDALAEAVCDMAVGSGWRQGADSAVEAPKALQELTQDTSIQPPDSAMLTDDGEASMSGPSLAGSVDGPTHSRVVDGSVSTMEWSGSGLTQSTRPSRTSTDMRRPQTSVEGHEEWVRLYGSKLGRREDFADSDDGEGSLERKVGSE